MPYLSGVLTEIVLTVLVVFLVDHYGANFRTIVNWAVLTEKLGAVKEEVRKDVHDATAPDNETSLSSPAVGETH